MKSVGTYLAFVLASMPVVVVSEEVVTDARVVHQPLLVVTRVNIQTQTALCQCWWLALCTRVCKNTRLVEWSPKWSPAASYQLELW